MNAEVDALVALVERWQKSRRAVRDAEDQDALGMAEQVLDVHEAALLAWTRPAAPVGEAERLDAVEAFYARVNDAAEADMLRGNPVTGAHHRALEREIQRHRAALASPVPQPAERWTPEYIADALTRAYPRETAVIECGDVIEYAHGDDAPVFQRLTHPAAVEDWNGKLRNRVRGVYKHAAAPAPAELVGPRGGLRYIADYLGLVDATEGAIARRIDEIVHERNAYQELEREVCEGEETLEECIDRHKSWAERSFDDGYQGGLETAIQAIEHDKEERQPYNVWDGMKRAIAAIEAVRDGTFVWVEDVSSDDDDSDTEAVF